jgi:hypothetical protein
MFLDPSRFGTTCALQRAFAVCRAELDQLAYEDFVPWPQAGAYEGDWRIFPMLLHQPPPGLPVDLAANRQRCPGTMRQVEAIGRIRTACFSWLGPSAHIVAHTDAYYHGLIRSHLGLRVPPRSLLRVADELRELEEGGVVMIDGQTEHEVGNLSAEPRVTLLVDVEMTAAEAAYVLEHSAARRCAVERHDAAVRTASPTPGCRTR